ncbi:Cytochrome P450 [Sesbania bispinosa]|nr:Cytochrome P450 [Sesbania bispinosa]
MANFQDYLQLFFVWLLSTIVVRAILTRKQRKGHHPPSPPSLPIIGHLHLISQLPHQSFHNLSARYGPIMQIYLGSVPCIVTSTPEIAKKFLKTHETCFSNRFISSTVHYLTYGSKGFLFARYGEYWRFMKKLCMSELLGGRTLSQLLPLRQQETLRFLNLLQKKGEAFEAVDVGGELLTLNNSIITSMTMSRTCSENNSDVEDIRKMVTDTAELVGKFNVSDFIWFCKYLDLQGMNRRLKEIQDRFDPIMERVIKEHQEERMKRKERGEGGQIRDILDILLEIQENESSEIKLTRENIKAFIWVVPTNLGAMIQCFEWKVDGKVNMEEKPAVTLPRAHPLICVPVPRFNRIPSGV